MKKNYFTIIAFIFFGSLSAQELQRNFINYQGVARNAENELMVGETLVIGIALKVGGRAAAPDYTENHSVSTDANGVFSLKIGNGEPLTGDYNNFGWGDAATFVTVSVNGNEIGTTEMMAVPYALSSGDGAQQADEVPYDNSISGLPATNAQEALDALAGGGTIDTDNQGLVLTGDLLTIQDGSGSVDLSVYVDDADADINNELQTLDFDPATNALSLSDGNTVIIPSGGTDADADPTNEFQNLSFDAGTNELSLTNGNSIVIPTGGTDADADPTNEIQNLVLTGDVLTIENGTGTVDLGDYRDSDTTTQNGILQGDGSTISGLVGTANGQVPKWDATSSSWQAGTDATGGGGSSLWTENGNDIYFDNGSVGIGTSTPNGNMELSGEGAVRYRMSSTTGGNPNFQMFRQGDTNTDWMLSAEPGAMTFYYSNDDLASAFKHTEFQENGDLNVYGVLQSQNLQGTGQRNVMADANGNLVIGAGGGTETSTGLEAIDEGNGIGWRLTGRNPDEYGNIGENAVDLSYSGVSNSDVGALGPSSTSLGTYTTASGLNSTAMGGATEASGTGSTAMGRLTTASGDDSTAMGYNTKASGFNSTAMGGTTEASGIGSTAMGYNTIASGENSTAMGYFTTASAFSSTAMGWFNMGTGNPVIWIETDPLFEIGNGETFNRSNAFTVLKNGNTGIGTHTPNNLLHLFSNSTALNSPQLRIEEDGTGYARIELTNSNSRFWHLAGFNGATTADDRFNIYNSAAGNIVTVKGDGDVTIAGALTQNSDRRLKRDIEVLPYGIKTIMQLAPKAYYWKKDKENNKKSLGLIAQEVSGIIPEIVHEDTNIEKTLSLSYTELIPVLIKAMQEQQEIILALKNEKDGVKLRLTAMENQIAELLKQQGQEDATLRK